MDVALSVVPNRRRLATATTFLSGREMDAPLTFELLDEYDQRVMSDGTSTLLAELVDTSGTTTLAGPLAICEQGLAMFTDLAIFATPGVTIRLKVSVPALGERVPPTYVEIALTECPAGMIEQTTSRDNVVCFPCEKYTYENQGNCVDCVLGMDCGAIGISLAALPMSPGYWRADERATEVYACPYGSDACSGGAQVRTCGAGYRGPGFHICEFPTNRRKGAGFAKMRAKRQSLPCMALSSF
jgi:hypothetical protein